MKNFAIALFVILVGTGVVYATVSNPVKPYTFTSGTSAKSAEVNADFDTIYSGIADTNAALNNVLSGNTSVPAADLATNSINSAKFGNYSPAHYADASNLSSGTLPDARFPATLPSANGSNLTTLNATQLTSGTVPTARLSGKNITKGWITFNGTTVGHSKGVSFYNISSVTRTGAGTYNIVIPSGLMANANYAWSGTCGSAGPVVSGLAQQNSAAHTATSLAVLVWGWDGQAGHNAFGLDCEIVSLIFYGE